MPFTVIAAVDEKLGIGKNGKLPWNFKGDLQHFKNVTVGIPDATERNAVIMGLTTWRSLPESVRPLPDRLNIVLTNDPNAVKESGDVRVASSFDAAVALAVQHAQGTTFIIGGASVYKQAVLHPSCERIMLTHIHATFDCDTFFPDIPKHFHETARSAPVEEQGMKYEFVTYERV